MVGRLVNVYRYFVLQGLIRNIGHFLPLLGVVMMSEQGSGGLNGHVIRPGYFIPINGRIAFFTSAFRTTGHAIPMVVVFFIRYHPLTSFRRPSVDGRRFRFVLYRLVSFLVWYFHAIGIRVRVHAGAGVVEDFNFSQFMGVCLSVNHVDVFMKEVGASMAVDVHLPIRQVGRPCLFYQRRVHAQGGENGRRCACCV